MKIQTWAILGRSFHFGVQGMGQEKTSPTLPSDSLFAALVSRLARSKGAAEVEQFCQPFVNGKPPFILSSTFPRVGNLRFFPPPLSSRVPSTQPGGAKTVKAVQYVSEEIYLRLLKGEMLASLGSVFQLQQGKLLLSRAEVQQLPVHMQKENSPVWMVEQRPRVSLDRVSQASTLFFTGQVTYAADCGLWFGVQWRQDDEALKLTFSSLLQDLADAGLGAERNTGLGSAAISELGALDLPDPLGRWTSLNRYLPAENESQVLMDSGTAYTLKSVGGWLDSPANSGQRRKTINLLTEGSVFGTHPTDTLGQMLDVRPMYEHDPDPTGHPVYRCGYALAVGLAA